MLHEMLSRGMRFWINEKNKLPIMEIHYTSDPDKDPATEQGKKWYEEMTAGVPEADVEREMEINWDARSGKRFYSEFSRDYIKKVSFNPTIPIIYRAWDFGYHHPAVLWIQVDMKDGNIYIIREMMGCDIAIKDFIEKFVLPHYLREKDVNGDLIVFKDCCDIAGSYHNDRSEKTSVDVLYDFGIRPISRRIGIKPGTDMVRQIIRSGKLFIDESCGTLISGFLGGYIFPVMRPGITKNESEIPEPGNYYGHLMDCLRYFVVNFINLQGENYDYRRLRIKEKYRPVIVGPGNKKVRFKN